MSDLQKSFDWVQIDCPQFEKLLWYNSKTGVYESGGEIIDKNDNRLVEYLASQKSLKPTDIDSVIRCSVCGSPMTKAKILGFDICSNENCFSTKF